MVGPGAGKDVGICRPKEMSMTVEASRTGGEGRVGDGEDFKVDALRSGEAAKVRKEAGAECMRRRAAEIRKYCSF